MHGTPSLVCIYVLIEATHYKLTGPSSSRGEIMSTSAIKINSIESLTRPLSPEEMVLVEVSITATTTDVVRSSGATICGPGLITGMDVTLEKVFTPY